MKSWPQHPQQLRGCRVEDPYEHYRRKSELERAELRPNNGPQWTCPRLLVCWRRLSCNRWGKLARDSRPPALRNGAQQEAVIHEQNTEAQHEVIKKRVVRAGDHAELPDSNDIKQYDAGASWQENHPDQSEFHH